MTPDPLLDGAAPGSVVRASAGRHGSATAVFDPTLRYRFRLSRVWDPAAPRLAFCMLNPSTADENQLDPTVRRCWGYAHAWGAGALEVVNLFALRSTDPAALYQDDDPIGERNDEAILAAARAADLLIAAWGTHGALAGRGRYVQALLEQHRLPVAHLGLTREGFPRHPLYLPGSASPEWLTA